LKRLAKKLVGADGECSFCNGPVDDSRHQHDRGLRQLRMALDVLANIITVFVRHDDVSDDDIRPILLDLSQCLRGVVACHYIDVFPAEGDLDHFAHGGAVVNEIHSRDSGHRTKPPSVPLWADSSSSRRASSISSVAE